MESIITLFEEQAISQDDKIALYCYSESISYKSLNKKSNQLARELVGRGLKKNTIVGLYTDRSIEMIIGMYAILKAGAAYLPLDPKYPDDRINNIISDSQIGLVLSVGKYAKKDFSSDLEWIYIDKDLEKLSKHDDSNLNIDIHGNDLAYVIYTSGSTGKPKGVLIEHKALMTLLNGFNRIAPCANHENCLSITPFSFDVSVWEFFISIPFGNSLYLLNTDELIDLYKFIDFIYKNKISTAYLPPSILSEFVRLISKINKPFPLKRLLLGVEPIRQSIVQSIKDHSEEIKIINGYGPTETTICATFYDFKKAVDPDAIVPIGKAVHDYEVYLVDDKWEVVNPGESGQIVIAGNGLSRGYLNRKELNSERFKILDINDKEQRFYLTGDYGKYLDDFNIEFIGRKDSQLKIRGHRVEIGEIEYAINQFSGIKEAVVISYKDKNNIVKLKAFYSLNEDAEFDKKELKNFLSESLPSYMIPSAFIQLQKIPRTSNEKVDRKFLLDYSAGDIGSDDIVKPETPTELKLSEIWEEVLENDRIGIKDKFYELGGDSINVAMIITRINENFEIDINVNDFYNNPDISSLAKFIDAAELSAGKKDLFRIDPISREKNKFPISFNQQELWLLDEFADSKKSNNICAEISLNGKIDFNIFKSSIRILVSRYEDLRTYFIFENGETFQCINKQIEFDLDKTDLSNFDEQSKNRKQTEIRDALFNSIIDLSKCPLFKFHFVKVEEGRCKLFFVIHHIVFDGWSMGILLTELSRIYSAILQDAVIELPRLNIQNIDYAKWQKDKFSQGLLNKEFDFWKNKLLPLNTDLRLTEKQYEGSSSNSGKRLWWRIPENDLKGLKDLSNDHASSLFNTIYGFFALFVYKHSLQKTIVIGTPYANRKPKETEKLIGYFTNMISLICEFDPKQTISQFLEDIHKSNIEAYSNASFPFGQLVKDLKIKRNDKKHPVFQVCFIMQNWHLPELDFDDIQLSQKEIGNNTSKFDLTLNIEILENELECWFEYKTEIFSEKEIKDYIIDFNDLLTNGYKNPELCIEEFIKSKVTENKLSTVLMGDGNLLIECAALLLKKKFSIYAIITNDINISNWCKQFGVDCYFQKKNIIHILEGIKYDWLFSIVNDRIIPEKVLSFANLGNINYHDSLLPKYAGLFSTSHAILNQEVQHGISWHIIEEGIDSGDILLQEKIQIEKDDTAFSLNLKCFNTAIKSFDILVNNIEKDNINPRKQDLSERSYYGFYDRPENACIIDWNKTAEEIYSLFKSLTFSNKVNNEFGSPKLLYNGECFITDKLGISDIKSGKKPGTIIKTKESGIRISTLTHDIDIDNILDIYGNEIEIENIFIKSENILPEIGEEINSLIHDAIKNESYWKSQFENFEMPELSFLIQKRELSIVKEFTSFSFHDISIYQFESKEGFVNHAVACFLLFLAKISNKNSFSILVENYKLDLGKDILNGLFSRFIPIMVDVDENKDLKENLDSALHNISSGINKSTFLNDIFFRYPDLKKKGAFQTLIDSPVIISVIGDKEYESPSIFNNVLNLIVDYKNQNLSIKYNKNIVNKSDIECLGNCFSVFFQRINDSSELLFNQISLLSDVQKDEIIFDWNNTKIDADLKKPVHEIIESIADRDPDSIALEFADKSYSYQQLNSIGNAYAAYINSLDYKEKFNVGILLDRSPEMIFIILGILKAGGAYIPLDTKYPPERISKIADDAGLSIIFTTSEYSHILPESIENKIFIDKKNDEIVTSFSSQNTKSEVSSDNDAYIIYTSGSTGNPKGVRISHKSLTSFTHAAIDLYKINQEDKMLQFASMTFDAAIEEIFPTLCSGACLVLRTDEMMESAEKFVSFCTNNEISIIDLPTSYWHLMMDEMLKANLKFDDILRLVILGGEAVSADWVKLWLDTFNDYPVLVNTYGPTETTVVATAYEVNTKSYQNPVPIGKPIGNVKTYVVDKSMILLPPGIPGELLIGGNSVSSGYLNNQQLTDEKFIKNPFDLKDKNRLYRSGDLVKYDKNGNIIFLGRIDKQVKIRGFRIELDEIDNVFKECKNVFESITSVYIDAENNKKLVNYYISIDKKDIESNEIKEFLESRLPSYMIPSFFIRMNSFPLTSSLKINYKAFPKPDFSDSQNRKIYLPENSVQSQLYEIFNEVLKLESFSTHDNFFDLGGDSLSAISVLSKITKIYGEILSLKEFYQDPNIIELALLINEKYHIDKSVEVNENSSNLITLQGKGEKTPVVMIFGDTSNQFLPQMLGDNQPYYAFIPLGSGGEKIVLKTVEDIAGLFADEIAESFKGMSIHLMGYSFGGLVALEIEKKLLSMGFDIKSITFIDTVSPDIWNTVQHNVSFRRKIKMSKYRWARRLSILFGVKVPVKYRNFYILESWQKAYKKYNPGKFDYSFHLITSTENMTKDKYLGWEEYISKNSISLHNIEGDHHSILNNPESKNELGKIIHNILS